MSSKSKHLRLRYLGERFSGAHLPVDVLSDLSAFSDLIVSYAKDEWRRRNESRTRLPSGFGDSLRFDLVAIKDGSAIPILEWNDQTAQEMLPDMHGELDELIEFGYSEVVSLLSGTNGRAAALDREKVSAIRRLGANLEKGEKIEIGSRSGNNVVYYNFTTREKLLENARSTYKKRVQGKGEIVGTLTPSKSKAYLILKTRDWGEIEIPVDPIQIYEEYSKRHNEYVNFDLEVELDTLDRFKGVVDNFNIEIEEEEHLARLTSLSLLRQGWHDGTGKRVTDQSLQLARDFTKYLVHKKIKPEIFPTEEGGILVDFETASWDYSAEFGNLGSISYWGIEVDGEAELLPQAAKNIQTMLKKIGL